jgi:hypothetical protein
MAIMRSRKVSPGLTAMRITSQSDSTRVPPVTAEKSPPASRITGADSPVMADSSTEATPSITSPSPGMVSPGLTAIFTTSQSDSTRVPPVTAEKSPPASRITGADSPVIADSSTEATPSITSPSPGMTSPATTSTTSPSRSSSEPTCSSAPFITLRARVLRRVCLSVSACALPRVSANASAKLAKRTVDHRITVTAKV